MLSLTVLGAGPKAVAVQAKAYALRQLGVATPEILVVDPLGVGGNWLPGGGWTNGRHLLGTSPLKDVGFPYRTRIVNRVTEASSDELSRQVDQELFQVSWARFLVDTNRYASWIDRGHSAPRHRLWAAYLAWVAQRTELEVLPGSISQICASEDLTHWSLSIQLNNGSTRELTSDSLMVTGPGTSSRCIADLPQVYSLARFWQAVVDDRLQAAGRVAVIGGGESAASVMNELVRHPCQEIKVISPAATIFSRGESQFENCLYTEPARWAALDEAARRDVISRTDHGVFSVRVQDFLHNEDRVSHLRGMAETVETQGTAVSISISDPVAGTRQESFDLVIDARGNSPLWFTHLMDDHVRELFTQACGGMLSAPCVEERIGADLAVEAMEPKLFLPTLSGLRQGPGFANLSCLGELSDRILAGVGVGELPHEILDADHRVCAHSGRE